MTDRAWSAYCEACADSGMVSVWCGPMATLRWPWLTERGDCGRWKEHAAHEWVRKCTCWDTNPKLVQDRERGRRYAQAAAQPAAGRGRR